jgi:hypothetical protein
MDATQVLEQRIEDLTERAKSLMVDVKNTPRLAKKLEHALKDLAANYALMLTLPPSIEKTTIASVLSMDGVKNDFPIDAFENVLSLKGRIEAKFGILAEDQELSLIEFERNQLEDYEMLRSCVPSSESISAEIKVALTKKLGVLRTLDTESIKSGCNVVALDFTTEPGAPDGAADFLYGSSATEKCELLCSFLREKGAQLKKFTTHNGNIEDSMANQMLSRS